MTTKRVRGGFRGIIAAIAAEWLDPEDPALVEVDHLSRNNADRRAAELREHRREKRRSRRSPF